MVPVPNPFTFDYFDSRIVYGRSSVELLEGFLEERDLERAMIVTGTNVGANVNVMGPIKEGLGGKLAGVFAETTPAKTAETVFDGIDAMEHHDADVLIGVGGGSSLDVARQISAFRADGRPLSAYREEALNGRLNPPSTNEDVTPVVIIPTTLAGACLSKAGNIAIFTSDESPTEGAIRVHGPVVPTGLIYDPDLLETTPESVLAASAMNGFDKAIETVYASNGSPVTDSTAVHSLRFFREGLPQLADDHPDAFDRALVAVILAQFRQSLFERNVSIIHSFGQGVSYHHPVQQGLVHGVMAPHVLKFIFDRVNGGREQLAMGLDIGQKNMSDDKLATAVLDSVKDIRDSLGLPKRLRDLEDVPRKNIPMMAERTLGDHRMENSPNGLDPTIEDLEKVLRSAW